MPEQTKKQIELAHVRRIYIFALTHSRAIDWMEGHGFLRPGWRDPRVIVAQMREQLLGIHEARDIHFEFLPDWKKSKSPQFLQEMWARFPIAMRRASMPRVQV